MGTHSTGGLLGGRAPAPGHQEAGGPRFPFMSPYAYVT